MINVVNKYKHIPTKSDVYIGRGSPLGNPFTSRTLTTTKAKQQVDSREKSIEKYREYIYGILESNSDEFDTIGKSINEILEKLNENGYVNLVCFCKPKKCHGDIIKQIIEELYYD